MANNVTLTIYLGSNDQGKDLLAKIEEVAQSRGQAVSPFIKSCIEKELNSNPPTVKEI